MINLLVSSSPHPHIIFTFYILYKLPGRVIVNFVLFVVFASICQFHFNFGRLWMNFICRNKIEYLGYLFMVQMVIFPPWEII